MKYIKILIYLYFMNEMIDLYENLKYYNQNIKYWIKVVEEIRI